jgi:hypothetical protein
MDHGVLDKGPEGRRENRRTQAVREAEDDMSDMMEEVGQVAEEQKTRCWA